MKLIDLLVQELPKRGGWPTLNDDIYRVSLVGMEWSPVWEYSPVSGGKFTAWVAEKISSPEVKPQRVNKQQYEAALAALQQASWNGEGLPPIGCICEAMAPPSRKGGPWSWQRVKVVEAGIDGAEKECLVYNIETTRPSWVDEFRPIRTEAEIRREDTKNAIAELCRASASNGHSADLIYDAIAAGEIPGVKLED